jgi:uncharacterized protein YbbC (DUF1343 family)
MLIGLLLSTAMAVSTSSTASAPQQGAPFRQVLNGIDVLERDGFKTLQGRKIALITNHTGRTRDGRFTSDVLANAPGVEMVVLFAPEHGLRGLLDEAIKDGKDEKTGLPVFSLYNPGSGPERYRPKKEHLVGVDTIVFDIQDIGTRYYTYVGTLGFAMEAAARDGLEVVVLDRPNPITAVDPAGPIADDRHLGLTAFHNIPLVHAMTAGELANLFNGERKIGAKVHVIRCEGWNRSQWWEETGLLWVNPSPNMRAPVQAHLYPGVGLLEATNVSVGRGTDTPFERIGAPWMNGRTLAAAMNAKRIPGVWIYPLEFTPASSVHANRLCGGVGFTVTDRASFDPVRLGCELAHELQRLFPNDWQSDRLVNLVQNDAAARAMLEGGFALASSGWQDDLDRFKGIRQRYLIYP